MSAKREGYSYSKANVRKVVEYLSRIDVVQRIDLYGSRSPKSNKKARRYSDWDLLVITENETVYPRVDDIFMTAVDIRQARPNHNWPNAVELWPVDEVGVLS